MAKKPTGQEALLQEIHDRRAMFRDVFTRGYGPQVLAWLGNESGAWSMEPEKKDAKHIPPNPYTVALFNRLLSELGIVHPENLVTIAEALLAASNDDDLGEARRKAARAQEKEEAT